MDSAMPSAERGIHPEDRVYCCRKLKMSRIRAIGFDMDHTLAIYKREIEDLAYRCTIEEMVRRGYPDEIRQLRYDRELAIRGLVVDKKLGNLIKLDRYKYVTDAYHGTRRLGYEERKASYSNRRLDLADPAFHNLDTLFTIPEAVLYAQMIDLAEQGRDTPLWNFRQLFDDIREAIDTAHRDGSLKSVVVSHLPDYFVVDPRLADTLARMRAAGKKVFLLTNSEPAYTDAVMRYILPASDGHPSWKDHFDVIAMQARKPGFFLEGTPMEIVETGEHYRMITGGNVEKLEALLGVSGEAVLYFGDHTYGDIMKSKKMSLWRTAMVVEELDHELKALRKARRTILRLDRLYTQKSELQDQIAREQEVLDHLRARKLGERSPRPATRDLAAIDQRIAASEKILRNLDKRLTMNLTRIRTHEVQIYQAHNRYWGPLFRAGTEKSRIGDQIEDFACLYTSKVSNFLSYPVNKYFVSSRDRMVHEIG